MMMMTTAKTALVNYNLNGKLHYIYVYICYVTTPHLHIHIYKHCMINVTCLPSGEESKVGRMRKSSLDCCTPWAELQVYDVSDRGSAMSTEFLL